MEHQLEYSVYLLYRCKRTNTDAAAGTKAQILTQPRSSNLLFQATIVDHDSAQLAANLVGLPVMLRTGDQDARCLLFKESL